MIIIIYITLKKPVTLCLYQINVSDIWKILHYNYYI